MGGVRVGYVAPGPGCGAWTEAWLGERGRGLSRLAPAFGLRRHARFSRVRGGWPLASLTPREGAEPGAGFQLEPLAAL